MKVLKHLFLAKPIFGKWDETIIWSCLEGVMGQIIVDDEKQPKSALAKLGEKASFGFLAGIPNLDLIENCRGEDIILVPQNQKWVNLIEANYPTQAKKFQRYATKKDTAFDKVLLEFFVGNLPSEYTMKAIDLEIYQVCLNENWSEDLGANYSNYDNFKELGLGFVAIYKGKVIAGASSYSTYRGGIEIEIDTHPAFRRKGLAKALASYLILECLSRGLYPSWDAHTHISLKLAQKLGYEFSYSYSAYKIDWTIKEKS